MPVKQSRLENISKHFAKSDGCWIWQGGLCGPENNQYGHYSWYIDGKVYQSVAHKVVYNAQNTATRKGRPHLSRICIECKRIRVRNHNMKAKSCQ